MALSGIEMHGPSALGAMGFAMTETTAYLTDYLGARGLRAPESLSELFATTVPDRLAGLIYRPGGDSSTNTSMAWAEACIDASDWPLLPNLVPLMPVDERSFACVVASGVDDDPLPGAGRVVRWHLDLHDEAHQAELLDTDCLAYAESVAEEMDARDEGLRRMFDEVGPAYHETHLSREKRPRDYVLRPVRIACQNVIVALAAIAQEASFDGLSVLAWQACEVPHVATHEANRALTVITLCDAFQNGGTMEIRFDREARVTVDGRQKTLKGHPEHGRVPASLRRFGRTVGVNLGAEDPAAILPSEARALFRAVTPMATELGERFDDAVARKGISPERLCFSLCKPIWRQIELDWLLAMSPRVKSILEGGAPWTDRPARQAETEACRAAVMAGMLHRRLEATDAAGASGTARVVEDRRRGVQWSVDAEHAAIRFTHLPVDEPLPWSSRPVVAASGQILVAFRSMATAASCEALAPAADGATPVLVIPSGIAKPTSLPPEVVVLQCPDRLADIDKTVDANLTTARISRA